MTTQVRVVPADQLEPDPFMDEYLRQAGYRPEQVAWAALTIESRTTTTVAALGGSPAEARALAEARDLCGEVALPPVEQPEDPVWHTVRVWAEDYEVLADQAHALGIELDSV